MYVAIHNGADEVIIICIDSQYQQREALIRVCAEILGGLTPRRLRSRSPFGAGRRSKGAFIASVFHQSPALGGPGSREEGTSVLICKEEGTSMHHLSTMPELLQPPLSLRVPCPEGIRQRRPRRERVCDNLKKLQFRWSGLNCCPW